MMSKKMKSVVALIALVSFLGGGCIGPFTLSHSLGRMNAKVENKWMAELVFLALTIFLVYRIASLLDLLILNPIWFWKAPNSGPMFTDDKTADIPVDKDRHIALTFSAQEGVLRADLFERGRRIDTIRVKRNADGSMVAQDENGRIRYESRLDSLGTRSVTDSRGTRVFAYVPGQLFERPISLKAAGPGADSWRVTRVGLP
jgi:Domain of unknown function (DUF3332)